MDKNNTKTTNQPSGSQILSIPKSRNRVQTNNTNCKLKIVFFIIV